MAPPWTSTRAQQHRGESTSAADSKRTRSVQRTCAASGGSATRTATQTSGQSDVDEPRVAGSSLVVDAGRSASWGSAMASMRIAAASAGACWRLLLDGTRGARGVDVEVPEASQVHLRIKHGELEAQGRHKETGSSQLSCSTEKPRRARGRHYVKCAYGNWVRFVPPCPLPKSVENAASVEVAAAVKEMKVTLSAASKKRTAQALKVEKAQVQLKKKVRALENKCAELPYLRELNKELTTRLKLEIEKTRHERTVGSAHAETRSRGGHGAVDVKGQSPMASASVAISKPETGLVAYYWDCDWDSVCGNGRREARRLGFTEETWELREKTRHVP